MVEDLIPLDEARKEVELVSKRLALLHLCYAKTLVDEYGEDRGTELVLKAIAEYGRVMGEKTREELELKGLEPSPENFGKGDTYRIPRFGMHSDLEETDSTIKLHGCVMGKLWREYGEEDLGKLYCYVDPAKYMGFNPEFIQVHEKAMPAGHEYCEFTVRHSTPEERELFRSINKDFSRIDPCLNL